MSKPNNRTDDVFFSVAQLQYLETLFPQVVYGPTAPESAMRHFFGQQAVIEAAQVRAKPIMLTALAAMIGALFILDDPIFNGLAISLIFGILVSTLLTLVVIPLLYYALLSRRS